MHISLLYFDDCPNWKIADARLTLLTAERTDLTMTRHLVETTEEAERVGFHGSPSILVDGTDVFAEPGDGVGLSCRVYRTDDGFAGAPTVEQLRAVLAVGGVGNEAQQAPRGISGWWLGLLALLPIACCALPLLIAAGLTAGSGAVLGGVAGGVLMLAGGAAVFAMWAMRHRARPDPGKTEMPTPQPRGRCC